MVPEPSFLGVAQAVLPGEPAVPGVQEATAVHAGPRRRLRSTKPYAVPVPARRPRRAAPAGVLAATEAGTSALAPVRSGRADRRAPPP